jgi:hypothetical protein
MGITSAVFAIVPHMLPVAQLLFVVGIDLSKELLNGSHTVAAVATANLTIPPLHRAVLVVMVIIFFFVERATTFHSAPTARGGTLFSIVRVGVRVTDASGAVTVTRLIVSCERTM